MGEEKTEDLGELGEWVQSKVTAICDVLLIEREVRVDEIACKKRVKKKR